LETGKFKLADIFNGIIIPLILVLLIFVLAVYVNVSGTHHIFGESNVIAVILTSGFAQMIVLGIPLVLGLLWNKWAGGAAGFIMGGIYYVANAGQFTSVYAVYSSGAVNYNFFGDLSMLFYLVNAVIIGYMAGALNNGSTNFKRMLGAGLTAAIITAVIQLFMNYNYSLAPAQSMAHGLWLDTTTGAVTAGSIAYGFTLAFIPSIALGVIVPILAKVMTWYGLQPMRH
jgi:hypothetical protein